MSGEKAWEWGYYAIHETHFVAMVITQQHSISQIWSESEVQYLYYGITKFIVSHWIQAVLQYRYDNVHNIIWRMQDQTMSVGLLLAKSLEHWTLDLEVPLQVPASLGNGDFLSPSGYIQS